MKYILLVSMLCSLMQSSLVAQQTVHLPFRSDASNLMYVEVEINGSPAKEFIFDTGASGVVINADLLSDLLATGALDATDFGPKQQVTVASGATQEVYMVNARELSIGGHVVRDVMMAVMPNESAPLLVGQNVFKQFSQVSIDYQREEILLSKGGGSSPSTKGPSTSTVARRSLQIGEVRIIPCSKNKEAEVENIRSMLLRNPDFNIGRITIEGNVPPPATAVKRIGHNYTVRYFSTSTAQTAQTISDFVEGEYCPRYKITNVDHGTENMLPAYNDREILDYVELWLK